MPDWEAMIYMNPKRLFVGCFIPNWVRERTELTMTAKMLYGTLVQHANNEGVAWPSQETLASEMGCTDRCIRSAATCLERHELIEVQQPGLGASNRYRFGWHEWMGLRPEDISARPEKSSARPEDSSKDKNQVKESEKKNPCRADAQLLARTEEVITHFNTLTGRRFSTKGGQSQYVSGRLREGATVEQMKLVAELKASEWKGNGDMEKYLRLETVYARGHWEDYLFNAEKWDKNGRSAAEVSYDRV